MVDVWATTWQLIEMQPYLRTCKLDLHLFLKQVLEGRRVWVRNDPVMPRLSSGRPGVGWVLLDDLDEGGPVRYFDLDAVERELSHGQWSPAWAGPMRRAVEPRWAGWESGRAYRRAAPRIRRGPPLR